MIGSSGGGGAISSTSSPAGTVPVQQQADKQRARPLLQQKTASLIRDYGLGDSSKSVSPRESPIQRMHKEGMGQEAGGVEGNLGINNTSDETLVTTDRSFSSSPSRSKVGSLRNDYVSTSSSSTPTSQLIKGFMGRSTSSSPRKKPSSRDSQASVSAGSTADTTPRTAQSVGSSASRTSLKSLDTTTATTTTTTTTTCNSTGDASANDSAEERLDKEPTMGGSGGGEGVEEKEAAKKVGLNVSKFSHQQRLQRLAQPKPQVAEIVVEKHEMPPKKVMQKRSIRPSILVRVKPQNVEAAMETFFQNLSEEKEIAPVFEYSSAPDSVRKAYNKKNVVDFSLLQEAKAILTMVMEEHGGPEEYLNKTYQGRRINCEELVARVKAYLEDLNLEEKVEIRTCPNMLSAANVVKPSPDGKYVVNLTQLPVSEPMVESICDHEIGTHLLRMINDEHQAWHGSRDRYNLGDPWVTEEGFATINTYRSMRGSKIMFPQALKYYATCLGSEMGFVKLFKELELYVPDPRRRFRVCCRVKRGLVHTSEPGAFNVDQAYFKGAVDILRKMATISFERLYSGQVALEDLNKVHFLVRKEVLRLPKFLNSEASLKTYLKHCRQMVEDNRLCVDQLISRCQKPVFIRAAKEFFAKSTTNNERSTLKPVLLLGNEKRHMNNTLPILNAIRLNDLSKPKQMHLPPPEESTTVNHRRTVDFEWLAEMAKPATKRSASEPRKSDEDIPQNQKKVVFIPSAEWERRLQILANPKGKEPTIDKKEKDEEVGKKPKSVRKSGSFRDLDIHHHHSRGAGTCITTKAGNQQSKSTKEDDGAVSSSSPPCLDPSKKIGSNNPTHAASATKKDDDHNQKDKDEEREEEVVGRSLELPPPLARATCTPKTAHSGNREMGVHQQTSSKPEEREEGEEEREGAKKKVEKEKEKERKDEASSNRVTEDMNNEAEKKTTNVEENKFILTAAVYTDDDTVTEELDSRKSSKERDLSSVRGCRSGSKGRRASSVLGGLGSKTMPRVVLPTREPVVRQALKMGVCVPMFDA